MQDDTPSPFVKRQAPWKLALNISLPVILLAIFAWQFKVNWKDIRHFDWHINWDVAMLGVLVLIFNSLLEVVIWNRTLRWFTDPLPFFKVVPVYIWSSLARYIPGKVASLALRAGLAAEADREVIPVLASSTVELALRTAAGLLVALLIFLAPGTKAAGKLMVAAAVVIPLVLICAHPKIMLPAMNWVLRKIKQQQVCHNVTYSDILLVFLATILRWGVYGVGFTLLVRAVYPPAWSHLLVLIGTGSFAWAAGFIGMSPGGLGLMEWVQKTILSDALHLPIAIALVLPALFRLATLIAEGLWALAAVFMRKTWDEGVSPDAKTDNA